jgi:hypothetical protein
VRYRIVDNVLEEVELTPGLEARVLDELRLACTGRRAIDVCRGMARRDAWRRSTSRSRSICLAATVRLTSSGCSKSKRNETG